MTQARTSVGNLEAITDERVVSALRMLGTAWDNGLQVEVSDEGVVSPSVPLPNPVQKEQSNVRRRRSGADSGPQARSALTPNQVRLRDVRKAYQGELPALREACPGLRVWSDPQGMWLEGESPILRNLGRRATFLVAVPFSTTKHPRAWAYWKAGNRVKWIGPRHTNLPDGSICAFGLDDRTWSPGDSLVLLMDLYSEWVAKHLYLEVFKEWPGQQHDLGPYYRLVEFKTSELCSCGSGDLYGNCCRNHDLIFCKDLNKVQFDFERFHRCSLSSRCPPVYVEDYMNGRTVEMPHVAMIADFNQ